EGRAVACLGVRHHVTGGRCDEHRGFLDARAQVFRAGAGVKAALPLAEVVAHARADAVAEAEALAFLEKQAASQQARAEPAAIDAARQVRAARVDADAW